MRIVFVHGQGQPAVCQCFKENVHKPKPLQTLYIHSNWVTVDRLFFHKNICPEKSEK